MNYYVIMPAHNEEAFLRRTLDSLLRQTLQPKKVIIVNDDSTDTTERIIDEFINKTTTLLKINTHSSEEHLPGSKVIKAFNKGLRELNDDFDFIVKLDADLILPDNYFERIAYIFKGRPDVGIAGGFIYEKDSNGAWILNHTMDKDHVRGAFKAYSKSCFKAIGGLKTEMGWDTVDELLAQYHGYFITTDETLKVKHLRPTGKAYNPKARYLQGRAMYTMRYGFLITLIASLKMAIKQRKSAIFFDNVYGYFEAKKEKISFMVSLNEGRFIKKLRWKKIKSKLLP
ncbi:glycosyl transferase family 2 [Maribacter sp. 4U21]|uniref:glycosyltransferase n=1 Tax=Maribacter sp. 4U21 TaxID=1889779 RepID=UPI000C15EAB3|nr:glycosyltransferase family A protein [Maribacter sp. 4U21]PIB29129.1 glycosyl transferase family 2 [Maribacter sp. 4U21]